ncbi:hypothetical protein DKX38_001901 [Salix brachista]|uniref:BZIP domain-containing protein n=1 Tax=Salix brachista TaxID=2182728 RepID=A0A5N5NMH4_9ROSI|nr:hypothetical protein DKX38_001901 [Salix brachista]
MWSLAADQNINKNNMNTKKVSSDSASKSPNTCSSPSTLSSPSPIPNQLVIGNSMEEVWNDINLASLHEQPSNYTGSNANANTNDHVLHGMTFQDLLATSSNKDTPTRVASKEPSSGGGNNLLKNSLGPSPATMLNLNYGKRPQENGDVSGGDRRHERMIKNRESAARSRARKQAYTTELELKVAMLGEENAKLRKQQERFLAAAPAQPPKKHTLYRTSTAPF